MNNLSEVIELVEEIDSNIQDEHALHFKDSNQVIDNILKKHSEGYEQFILSSVNDFKINDNKTNLIILFDFKDEYILNTNEEIELYISNNLNNLITHLGDEVSSDNGFVIYFLNNHFGKMLQIQQHYNLINTRATDSWPKIIIDKLNNYREDNNRIHRNDTKKVQVLFSSFNIYKNPKSVKVTIDSRVKRSAGGDLEEHGTSGDVYTANLFDLVELFGSLGNELFRNNLRGKVDDRSSEVDKGIQDTLEKYPKEFWYLNNGISLLVDEKLLSLKHPKQLIFEISKENIKSGNYNLSVINGAQTLNAAAEFFFNLKAQKKEKQEELDKIIKMAREHANVILRVIKVENPDVDEINTRYDWVNKIAISLNSQKPIKKEDIVSTTYFIQAINMINESDLSDEFSFSIVKRGNKSSIAQKKYRITELAKIIVTYLELKPSKARNSNLGVIGTSKNEGKMEFRNSAFLNQSDLIDSELEFEDRVKNYKKNVFDSNYKPVNYLMALNGLIDSFVNPESNKNFPDYDIKAKVSDFDKKSVKNSIKGVEKKLEGVLSFGKYHLILTIYQSIILKDVKDQKIENWTRKSSDIESLISNDKIVEICHSFIKAWDSIKSTEKSSEYNINDFRKEQTPEEYKLLTKEFLKNYSKTI